MAESTLRERAPVSRRTLLRSLGVGVAGSVLADSAGSAAARQGSWPQFGHGAANTGHASGHAGPTDGVRRQWDFDAGRIVVSSPAVVDGTVYICGGSGGMYALAPGDGT
jgi:outer membrane protein assembly factor BamB